MRGKVAEARYRIISTTCGGGPYFRHELQKRNENRWLFKWTPIDDTSLDFEAEEWEDKLRAERWVRYSPPY